MRIVNTTKGREIAGTVLIADSVLARLKGLLGRKSLERDHSLWLVPCKGIHTIWMKFPIDVAFLDEKGIVISVRHNLSPNRMTRIYLGARSAIELAAGRLAETETEQGDRIEII